MKWEWKWNRIACSSGLKLVIGDALALHPKHPMSVWNMHLRGEVYTQRARAQHAEFGVAYIWNKFVEKWTIYTMRWHDLNATRVVLSKRLADLKCDGYMARAGLALSLKTAPEPSQLWLLIDLRSWGSKYALRAPYYVCVCVYFSKFISVTIAYQQHVVLFIIFIFYQRSQCTAKLHVKIGLLTRSFLLSLPRTNETEL